MTAEPVSRRSASRACSPWPSTSRSGETEPGYDELVEGRVVDVPESRCRTTTTRRSGLAVQLEPQLPAGARGRCLDLDVDLRARPARRARVHAAGPTSSSSRRSARQRVRREGGIIRASEVVVAAEFVSPGSRRTDHVVKRAEYADAGIPHYWIVDLDEPVSLIACHLGGEFGYVDGGAVTGVFTHHRAVPGRARPRRAARSRAARSAPRRRRPSRRCAAPSPAAARRSASPKSCRWMPWASSTGRRPTSSTRSPARSPPGRPGCRRSPRRAAGRCAARTGRPRRRAPAPGCRPRRGRRGAPGRRRSRVATIRRVVAFTGTASPSPTPATAVLIPTTRARRVGERAAGVAGVERRVGLDHVLDHPARRAAAGRQRPPERADHARRDRAREPERVARPPPPAGRRRARRRRRASPAAAVAPRHGAQHGEVRERVGAHHGAPSHLRAVDEVGAPAPAPGRRRARS